MFCREQVARINEIVDDLSASGVSIVAIGNGTALMARDFAETFAIQYPLYTDPKREAYQHFGLLRKLGLGFSALKRGVSTFKKGFRQGAVQGDPLQQGGVILCNGLGQVVWSHIDEGPGAHADLDEIRKAVQRLSSTNDSLESKPAIGGSFGSSSSS